MEPSRESTLYQNLDVPYKKPATALAIDSTGAFAALGGKKGIYITDLEEPWDQPKLLHHNAKQTQWDTSVIHWNPHAEHSSLIASAANKDVFIWKVDDKRSALQATFAPHARPVSDLCWALSDPNVLATCSADTYVILWDVRAPKTPLRLKAFCAWTAGVTAVKWNRRNPRLLASVHEGEVFVWDVRKESAPITKIMAHKQISSLDWSYHSETQLVTSSTDRTVKFWDYQQPTVCQAILHTANPVSKVKYTPFGRAIMTISQRSDYAIRLWSLSDLEQPIYQFMGHKDVVSALDWRVCDVGEDYEYQLVSWSKDQNLRMWPIEVPLINSMQAREAYGTRSMLPSASTSLTKEGFGSSLGIVPSFGASASLTSDSNAGFGLNSSGITPTPGSRVLDAASQVSGSPRKTSSFLTSVPSTPGGFNSAASISSTITNLEQEFLILQRRPIQGVVMEEMNLTHRTLQMRLGRLPYLLRLSVSFPSVYPHFAAPSFEFLPTTDMENNKALGVLSQSPKNASSIFSSPMKLSEEEKLALKMRSKQLLVKVAAAFVSINLVCVDPCCTQLLELLESFHTDPKLVLQQTDPDKDLTIKPEEYYKSHSLSSGSVPSTPSKPPGFNDDSSSSSSSTTNTLSSSIGRAERMPRLTFLESSSSSSVISTLSRSPPTKGNDLPKTTSDMNLNRYLENDYLPTSAIGAKLPASQSMTNLTSLTNALPAEEAPRVSITASEFNGAQKSDTVALVPNPAATSSTTNGANQDFSSNSQSLGDTTGHTPHQRTGSNLSDTSDDGQAGKGSRNTSQSTDILLKAPSKVAPKPPGPGTPTLTPGSTSTTSLSLHTLQPASSTGVLHASTSSIVSEPLPTIDDRSNDSSTTTTPRTTLSNVTDTSQHTLGLPRDLSSNIVPAPRSVGAVFFSTGKLLIFGHKQRQGRAAAATTTTSAVANDVRTFSDFLQVMALSATRTRPKNARNSNATTSEIQYDGFLLEGEDAVEVKAMEGLPRASSMSDVLESDVVLLDDDSGVLRPGNDSSQTYNRNLLQMSHGGGPLHRVQSDVGNSHSARSRPDATSQLPLRVEWVDNVNLLDLSRLIPVHPTLAKLYTLYGNNTAELCAVNLQAAKSVRRKDLVKMWSIVEAQTHPSVYPAAVAGGASSAFDLPWASHPFGRTLLLSLFRHFESIGDVQTLAMLSCVIAGPMALHGVNHNFPSAEKRPQTRKNPLGHHRASSLTVAQSEALTRAPPVLSASTASAPRHSMTSVKPLSATHSGLPRDKAPDPLPLHTPPADAGLLHYSLIEHEQARTYNQYRRAYAEILYMWNEYSERARILKYVADPSPANDGIDFVIVCEKCGKPSKTPFCQNCKIYGFNCDICHLRVKGMSSWCLKCGHGGHADHLRKWFAKEKDCPAGCGCVCMQDEM